MLRWSRETKTTRLKNRLKRTDGRSTLRARPALRLRAVPRVPRRDRLRPPGDPGPVGIHPGTDGVGRRHRAELQPVGARRAGALRPVAAHPRRVRRTRATSSGPDRHHDQRTGGGAVRSRHGLEDHRGGRGVGPRVPTVRRVGDRIRRARRRAAARRDRRLARLRVEEDRGHHPGRRAVRRGPQHRSDHGHGRHRTGRVARGRQPRRAGRTRGRSLRYRRRRDLRAKGCRRS